METKDIVILGLSKWKDGIQIVGKDLKSGKWIRILDAETKGPITKDELTYMKYTKREMTETRKYSIGGDLFGTVISVKVEKAASKGYRSEDVLVRELPIVSGKKVFMGNFEKLGLIDNVDGLWINGGSTKRGLNNQFPESRKGELSNSLAFIKVEGYQITDYKDDEDITKRETSYVEFSHKGVSYKIRMTALAKNYHSSLDETAYLCIGLGEPFEGKIHKFVLGLFNSLGEERKKWETKAL